MQDDAEIPQLSAEQIKQIDEVFPAGSFFSFLYDCVDGEEQRQFVAGYSKLLAWILQQREPRISYAGLNRIVFSGDYYAALEELGAEFNRTFTTTREPNAIGMAVTNNVPGGCIVTLNGVFAQTLIGEDADQRGRAQHVLVHELCHVSDEAHSARVFADVWLKPPGALEARLLPLALGTWNEYFANRCSSYLMSHPTETTEMLTEALQSVEHDITVALQSYRLDANLDVMLSVLAGKLRFMAQCIGYVAGILHGIGVTLDDLDSECASAIGASRIAPHWGFLLAELEQLNATYADWQDIYVLDGLCARWRAITVDYGFHYQVLSNGGLYVNIPRRNDGI